MRRALPRARTALVLAAHGAREESAAHALVRRHAEALARRGEYDEVAVAFHQGTPAFDGVLDGLTATRVTVVPFLTSAGHFADVVLPAALRRNRRFEQIRLVQTPPLGTHPALAALVARRATALLRGAGLAPRDVSIVVVGHGTRRHAGSRTATLALVDALAGRRIGAEVLAAFLDDEPALGDIGGRVQGRHIVVIPFLIGGGGHALRDIPAALGVTAPAEEGAATVQHIGERTVVIDVPVGTLEGVSELLADLARRHGSRARRRARPPAAGAVQLVGAGPGDPGLITVRGLEALRRAEVVVYDRLASAELLADAAPGAELVDVGKTPGRRSVPQEAINTLLVSRARAGRRVVRLKGGDPFVFGRGSEELEACRAAGVHCEVIPGISSALAAPAAAGIPVTARGISRSFAVVTGHRADDEGIAPAELAALAAVDTLVILMGRATLGVIAERLIAAGRDAETPAACIQSATTPAQRVTRATLGTMEAAVERDGLASPMVVVIGAVAALADVQPWADGLTLEPAAASAVGA